MVLGALFVSPRPTMSVMARQSGCMINPARIAPSQTCRYLCCVLGFKLQHTSTTMQFMAISPEAYSVISQYVARHAIVTSWQCTKWCMIFKQ